ncbi:MAG: cadherin-like domain-containing protein, partial [Cyanobacteria bacterium J06598_3]
MVNTSGVTVTDNNSSLLTIEGTVNDINAALNELTFTPNNNFTGSASIQMLTTDNGLSGSGGVKTDSNFIQITVNNDNDAPEVSLPGGTATYTEDAIPLVIDAAALVSDIDSDNFNGGTLTLALTAGGTASDRMALRNQGDGPGQIGLDGRIVTFEGSRIGTLTGGTRFDGTLEPLVIRFDTSPATEVTPAIAEALLRNATYANTSQNPTADSRTLTVTLRETDSTTSTPVSQTISLTPTNDAPILGNTLIRYDGALNTLPDAQGWTYVGPGVTPTVGGGVTNLNTTATNNFLAGFTRADQTLDAAGGFTISFTARINSENHAGSNKDNDGIEDRAGFSLVVVSDDPSKAIEIDFWSDRIWAQADGTDQNDPSTEPDDPGASGFETLFTQAEGVSFDTTSLVNYDLTIQGSTYTLYANGEAVLTGQTRDYTAATGAIDPYETPNLIAFSDNTPSARANVDLASVSVTTTESPLANGAYTEDGPATVLFGDVNITDFDSPLLTGATLTISAGLTAGDELNFTDQNGITGSFNSGVLNLSGSASAADYQAAIQGITYRSSNNNPEEVSSTRTVDLVVSDGTTSNPLSRTVDITAVNDNPVTSGPVEVIQNEDAGIFTVALLDGTVDPDTGDTISITNLILTSGNDAGVTINGDSLEVDTTIYGDLAAGEAEVVTYSYDIIDGNGGTVSQTATISITGTNTPPTVVSALSTADPEDSAPFSLNLLQGASDADPGDAVSVANLTLTSGNDAGITISSTALNIAPDAYNFLSGSETETVVYSYDVIDTNGGSVSQTATINILGSNDDPIISAAVSQTQAESAGTFSVDLLAGTTDPDTSDTLSVSNLILVSGDNSGVSVVSESLEIDAAAYSALAQGESETIEYRYDIIDGNGGSVSQTATITITGENSGPVVAAAITETFSEDDAGPLTIDMLAGASDPDGSDTLAIANLSLVSGDDAGITIAGTDFEINPDLYTALGDGESAVVEYRYDIIDGNGGSVSQTATIAITGENDAPTVAAAITEMQTEDAGVFSVDLLAGAGDVDAGDIIAIDNFTLTRGDNAGVTNNGDSLEIDAAAYNSLAVGESEVIEYSYDIVDGNGDSVSQTATITITGENDAPTVVAAIAQTETEDAAPFTVDLLAGASDADTSDTLSIDNFTLTRGDNAGVTNNGDSLEIDPAAYSYLSTGESEVIEYSYDIIDGNGGSVEQTATITIEGTNDAPVITGPVIRDSTEDTAAFSLELLAGTTDPEGQPLTVSNFVVTSGDDTGLTLNGNTVEIDPNAYDSLADGEQAVIEVAYEISDGSSSPVTQTATITIDGVNDAPVIIAPISFGGSEDAAPFSVNLLAGASDVEGQALSVSALTLVSGRDAGVTDNGDGTLSVDPAGYADLSEGDTEAIVYTFNINDTQGSFVEQRVTITLVGANDKPVALNVAIAATEDGSPITELFDANDADINDDGNLTFTIASQPIEGSVTIDPADDTQFIFDPGADFQDLAVGETRDVTFTYTATDAQNSVSDPATVTVTVTGVNDNPAGNTDRGTGFITDENTAFTTGNTLTNDDDIDGDTLSVTSIDVTSTNGLVTDNGDGTFAYDPNGQFEALTDGQSATDSFTYTADDGNGGSTTATVEVTINGVNDAPIISDTLRETFNENVAAFSLDLLSGTTDPEGDALTVSNFAVVRGNGAGLTLNGNTLDIDPNAYNALATGEREVVRVAYDIEDGSGNVVSQRARIVINGRNDNPSAIAPITIAGSEDNAPFDLNLLTGATDAEGQALSVSGLTLVSGNGAGITDNG